jgi:hypothetical protein
VRQDGKDGFARGALERPDGEPTPTESDIMRVARQAPTAATGRLVFPLQAEGEEESQYARDARLGIPKELKVRCLILKIDRNRAVGA